MQIRSFFGTTREHVARTFFGADLYLGSGFEANERALEACFVTLDMTHLSFLTMVAAQFQGQGQYLLRLPLPMARYDDFTFTYTVEDALACVIHLAIREGWKVDSIDHRDNRVRLYVGEKLIADIRPFAFERVDELLVRRIERALKGVGVRELGRAAARLRDVPGLESIVGNDDNAKYVWGDTEYPLHATLNNCVGALKRGVSRFQGRDLPISTVQEMLAQAMGVRNWSTLCSFERGGSTYGIPFLVSDPERQEGFRFYSCMVEAIAGFAERSNQLLAPKEVAELSVAPGGGAVLSVINRTRGKTDIRKLVGGIPEVNLGDDRLKAARQVLAEQITIEEALRGFVVE